MVSMYTEFKGWVSCCIPVELQPRTQKGFEQRGTELLRTLCALVVQYRENIAACGSCGATVAYTMVFPVLRSSYRTGCGTRKLSGYYKIIHEY